MPNKVLLASAVSLLGTLAVSGSAYAGHCGAGQNCDMGVSVYNDYAPKYGDMTVRNTPPMGHFSSINFQRAPNVSITRVHGMMPNAGLSDAPTAFTGGCHPESTQYCRQDVGTPVTVEMAPQPMPAPVYQAPAPVVQAPVQLRTWVGKGYDPSKFTPRTYGDASLVPGIAYLPTSKVVRDPAAAQAVLDSGKAVAQSTVLGGTAPHMGMVAASPQYSVTLPTTHSPSAQRSVTLPGAHAPYMGGGMGAVSAPAIAYDSGMPQTVLQETPFPAPAMAPRHVGNNTYVSNIGADGTYWEKTSGLTTFGNTVATQVICKRKVEQKVVNPVVGVPVPVPTRVVNPIVPMPVAVPTPVEVPYCETTPMTHPHPEAHLQHGHQQHQMLGHSHNAHHGNAGQVQYGQPMPSRWIR